MIDMMYGRGLRLWKLVSLHIALMALVYPSSTANSLLAASL